ncbi:hypothetical protein DXN05_14510 [Deminuibacter soli]|uniref:Uncharacterized protein n=1 Tax=Deminuibacter soli TaxID=2291815 RepID=A0A3E1NHB9_9BACT|nr:hypothetical protein DXN05_14510 [Deminuibacter soli]
MSALAIQETVPLYFDFKDPSDLVFFVLHIAENEELLIIECEHPAFVKYFKSTSICGDREFTSFVEPKPSDPFHEFYVGMRRAVKCFLKKC